MPAARLSQPHHLPVRGQPSALQTHEVDTRRDRVSLSYRKLVADAGAEQEQVLVIVVLEPGARFEDLMRGLLQPGLTVHSSTLPLISNTPSGLRQRGKAPEAARRGLREESAPAPS